MEGETLWLVTAITTTIFQFIFIDFQCPRPTLQNSTGIKFNDSQISGDQLFQIEKQLKNKKTFFVVVWKEKNREKIDFYTNTNININTNTNITLFLYESILPVYLDKRPRTHSRS